MIETSAPPYIYCSLLFSPLQKKNDYQRTETVSLGEVKHLVSFLDKGGKKSIISHFWEKMHLPVLADLPLHLRNLFRLETVVLTSACEGLH